MLAKIEWLLEDSTNLLRHDSKLYENEKLKNGDSRISEKHFFSCERNVLKHEICSLLFDDDPGGLLDSFGADTAHFEACKKRNRIFLCLFAKQEIWKRKSGS